MNFKISVLGIIISLTLMLACNKSTEEYVEEFPVSSFFTIKIGDTAYYRLDSLEFTVTLQNPNVLNHYFIREYVSDTLRDNMNQLVWRITRYISTDTTGNDLGQYWNDYYITIKPNQVEVTENNLRFIKLKSPVRENFSWAGNSFLPSEPYPQYDFSIDNNMAGWNYTYLSTGKNVTINNGASTYGNVCTIEQINLSSNIDNQNNIIIPDAFASKEKSVEQYALNKGLIYKEKTLWEFQPTKGKRIGFVSVMWRVNK